VSKSRLPPAVPPPTTRSILPYEHGSIVKRDPRSQGGNCRQRNGEQCRCDKYTADCVGVISAATRLYYVAYADSVSLSLSLSPLSRSRSRTCLPRLASPPLPSPSPVRLRRLKAARDSLPSRDKGKGGGGRRLYLAGDRAPPVRFPRPNGNVALARGSRASSPGRKSERGGRREGDW